MNESLSFRNSKLLREVSTADAIYLRFPEHTHHPYDLIQIFEADTKFLRDAMHGISIFHNIYSIRFGSLFLLALQVDDISFHQGIITLQVVVLHKFLPTNIKFVT